MDKNSYHANDRPSVGLPASYTQHTLYPSSFASNMGYFPPQPSKLQLFLAEMTPTPEIAFAELERTLIDIMNECSKHNIEMGKAWMLKYCTYPHHFEAVMEYLIALSRSKNIFYERLHLIYLVNDILFHGERKSISYIKPAIYPHLVPLLRLAYHLPNQGSTDSQRDKVLKVISIWAEKQFFDKAAIEQIREAVLVPPPPEGPRPPLLSNSMSPQHSYMRMLPSQQQYHTVSQYHPPFPPPSAMSPPPSFRPSQDQPPPPGMQILPPLQPPPPGLSTFSPPHVPPSQYTSSTPPPPPPSFQLPPNPVSSFTAPPTITAQEKSYYELPAGLMVTVTSPSVPTYTPFRKSLIRIPPGGRPAPSQELLNAVEQFYVGLPPTPVEGIEEEEIRDIKGDGWEERFLDAFYEQSKAEREKCNKEREEKEKEERERRIRERDWRARARSYSRERSRSKSFSRSRSRSRGRRNNDKRRDERVRDKRYRSRSYSLSKSRSRGRSRSMSRSISRTRSRSRSRSRSRGYTNYHHSRAHNSRRRSDSRSRSYRRSRSRSGHRGSHHRRRRSYTPSFTSASRSRSRSRSPPRRRRSRTPSRSPIYQHGGLGLGPSSFSNTVPPSAASIKTFLPAENVGHQMLKKLGWSGEGTGLGTTEREGIAEPIAPDGSRPGIGEMKFLGVGAGGMGDDMFDQYRRGKSYTYNKELVRPRGEREEEKCYRCGKPGHIARDCHDPARPFLK